MDSDTFAVQIENIGKKYIIGQNKGKARYVMLRETIVNTCRNFFRRKEKTEPGSFWALKDIYCTINPGERVAFIGRNGAGKSTLLKILSRITHPTTGKVTMNGRVAGILEVGTGFHHELTGRENIYMNGAILGMKKQEIKRKFDDIVAFSEIEKFLDTPVKRYSSGMYVRLAFAIAAHLRSDILIVDEVLAVGDYQFREKCLDKMNSVAREENRTILFVSHSIEQIKRLCTRAVWLQEGCVIMDSMDVLATLNLYTQNTGDTYSWIANEKKEGKNKNPYCSIRKFYLSDSTGNTFYSIKNHEISFVNVELDVLEENDRLAIGYQLTAPNGIVVYISGSGDMGISRIVPLKKGFNHIRSQIPQNLLAEGSYKAELIGYIWHSGFPFLHPSYGRVPHFTFEVSEGLADWEFWRKKTTVVSPVLTWEKVL